MYACTTSSSTLATTAEALPQGMAAPVVSAVNATQVEHTAIINMLLDPVRSAHYSRGEALLVSDPGYPVHIVVLVSPFRPAPSETMLPISAIS